MAFRCAHHSVLRFDIFALVTTVTSFFTALAGLALFLVLFISCSPFIFKVGLSGRNCLIINGGINLICGCFIEKKHLHAFISDNGLLLATIPSDREKLLRPPGEQF
jgi:hypothetical protein